MSFRLKTVLGIALIEIVLLFILILTSLKFLRESNEQELSRRAAMVATLAVTTTKNAVLSSDIASLIEFVDEFIKNPGVSYIRILNTQQVLAEALAPDFVDTGPGAAELHSVRIPIQEAGVTYGWVETGLSVAHISAVIQQAQQRIVLIAAIEIVLVALFSWLLGTYLTRGLRALTKATLEVARQDFSTRLPVTGRDELSLVIRAFNDMSDNLHKAYVDLQRTGEQAAQASRIKSQFLMVMNHEIRTPLNAILGYHELLAETALDDKQRQYVQAVEESGEVLLALIDDILDLSRLETDGLTLEQTVFDPRSLVLAAVAARQVKAQEQHLRLSCYIEPTEPLQCLGDPKRVRQVLSNLLSNALKFTHQGEVAVTLRRHEGHPMIFSLTVKDTGIGIAPDIQEQLFSLFMQADFSNTRRYGGSGLGLAIAKRLVELWGGQLDFVSRPGQGSTFSFTFGQHSENAPWILSENIEQLPPQQSPVPVFADKHVLLVEDSPTNQTIVLSLLKPTQIHIDIAEDGLKAIACVQQRIYDAIFMDIAMPGLDGFETTRKIRALGDWRASVPIIALTANVANECRETCLQAGMNDYATKPVNRKSLVMLLERWLTSAWLTEPEVDNDNSAFKASVEHAMLDEATLLEMLEDAGGPEVLEELLDVFMLEMKRRIDTIGQVKRADVVDLDCLQIESHTLKSTCATFGALRLQHIARQLEEACRASNQPQALSLIEPLSRCAQETEQVFLQFLHARSSR